MLPKLRNERVINMVIKYNTKQVVYNFNFNHLEFKKTDFNLTAKMLCTALSQENTIFFKMLFKEAFKIMNKRDKRYFNKINKQSKN
jgi:hypothetical protein